MAEIAKDKDEDLKPRNYQIQLMNIALEQNTILYLPTGSGKTFIAVMVLKRLSQELEKPINEGGKVTVLLVNTVALVEQHTKTLRRHTVFKVGGFSGELNTDNWSVDRWKNEINSYQVLVMTAQIAVNIVSAAYLGISNINLLIFDECHHAVNDEPMRQLMKLFEDVEDPPRILGLTATLLNGNVKPDKVLNEVLQLESTFQSKVATVDELKNVIGFSTNPTESIKTFSENLGSNLKDLVTKILQDNIEILQKIPKDQVYRSNLINFYQPLSVERNFKDYINMLNDVLVHVKMLGLYGGLIAALAHMINLERIKRHCEDQKEMDIINFCITILHIMRNVIKREFKSKSNKEIILYYSSPKLLLFLDILREYKAKSKEPLSALIFTERRFTSKVLYHIFKQVKDTYSEFAEYDADFIVGFSNNPNLFSRESLYTAKMNKKAIQKFDNKETNILFSTKVLEEGIDIRLCTLVIRFDVPMDYRSYIQSKGRARHKNSFFSILVDANDAKTFFSKYHTFQQIEQILNEFLIGKNDERDGPSENDINKKYEEATLPPYYVDGPGSPQINILNSISKLSQYCMSLASDMYTVFEPEWYLEKDKKEMNPQKWKCRVVIELPIVCPITECIKGTWEVNKKDAKRTAAYNACVLLHRSGELDNNLRPVGNIVPEEDTKHFFKHWPETKDAKAGNTSSRRPYTKQVPKVLQSPSFYSNNTFYLHVINFTPQFSENKKNLYTTIYNELITNDLCYGIITSSPMPTLCGFPIYISRGEISVKIETNAKFLKLNWEQLNLLRHFNYLVYHDVLKILKDFLILNNNFDVCQCLIAPISKSSLQIQFGLIEDNKEIADPNRKPTVDEILSLEVTKKTYFGKIVIPWYKPDNKNYVVVEVCNDMDADSPFPSTDYDSFANYFHDKYNIVILNAKASLLHVKALGKNLNCLKPRKSGGKRKREDMFEEVKEHICPELCVKQDFPSALWLQASLIPSVLHRFDQILRAEELRSRIAKETRLGVVELWPNDTWEPLVPVNNLEEVEEKKSAVENEKYERTEEEISTLLKAMKEDLKNMKREVNTKMLDQQYPWSEKDEPIDIERNIDVTPLEIQYYDNFISQPVNVSESLPQVVRPSEAESSKLLAITIDRNYKYSNIKLISKKSNRKGPQLREIYQALCTAKCNEIDSLERLETLGDSFLKIASTLFIFNKFPKFNEGRATQLKGRLVSNKNLYYLGIKKNLQSYVKMSEFSPNYEWLPPGFCLPPVIIENNTKIDLTTLLTCVDIPREEAISGVLSNETNQDILFQINFEINQNEQVNDMIHSFFQIHVVPDKTIADCVEALLGAYFQSNGINGALRMLEWFEIIPPDQNITQIFKVKPENPLLRGPKTEHLIYNHLTRWDIQQIEQRLGYTFNNKGFLLQALTHSSYTPNRVTNCYQRLEFLGDAVLDFLITCHIFESCGMLNPGELTDLRSALVNNITFAGVSVRLGLHKFLLFSNQQLSKYIDSFVANQETKDFVVDEQVLILLEEKDTGMFLAEHIDVPKVLGDIYEAVIGAIFLDSGNSLQAVWKVVHKIMWQEISSFKDKVPKNAIRLLYEFQSAHPQFYDAVKLNDMDMSMMRLDFMCNGVKKTVYGFGENRGLAKRAAAKFALRLLQ